MGRQSFAESQWRKWVKQQSLSKHSVRAFCEQRGLCQQTFYRWRKKLASDDRHSSEMVPVKVIADSTVIINLPCGAQVQTSSDVATLTSVLRAVRQSAGPDEVSR